MNPERPEQQRYEIRVQGRLDQRWSAWFDGLDLTSDGDGTTTIHGPVVDQAALHGVLQKLRDTGLSVISVVRVPAGPARGTTSRSS
ncbi:hypothetical protein [Georgenia subflava]|uniref:Uncharacterized protein n=1 Tax=Georgenia subflava TaxID=1622177 RepID=A0A6N7EKV8_9MICO|nr:hypothetical protein [Georgenia subflava]MPV37663.1 hypothetical protein [Georgenia subflava]